MSYDSYPAVCTLDINKSWKLVEFYIKWLPSFINDAQMISTAKLTGLRVVQIAITQHENMLLITVLTTFCDKKFQLIISFMSIDHLVKF